MSIEKKIKELTVHVLDQYAKNIPANESIGLLIQSGEIENLEILKRICEQFNNSIYLTMYRNPNINKFNITFDKADFDELKNFFNKKEEHMSDYDVLPENYKEAYTRRNVLESEKNASLSPNFKYPGTTKNLYDESIIKDKIANLEKFVYYTEIEKISSQKKLEQSFMELEKSVRECIYSNDSLTDLTKIASRYIQSRGYTNNEIVRAITMISHEASKDGYALNTQLTKISSMQINDSKEFDVFEQYQKNLDNARAFENMHKKASETLALAKSIVEAYENSYTR